MADAYPKFQDLKLYLNIDTAKDDALLVVTLKRAIATFENMCGRTFVPAAETRYFDANDEQVITGKRLFIRDGDLIEIVELKIDSEIVPEDEYFCTGAKPYNTLRITEGSDFSFRDFTVSSERSIAINGLWGYQDEVPNDVFGAIVRLAAWLYQQKDNAMELDRPIAMSNAMVLPPSLPTDVAAIAGFYRKVI